MALRRRLGISFGLAPADDQGRYQGAYGMGYELGKMLAPVVVTTLALGWGVPGWLVLGALFLLLGALVPPVVRWAGRTRPRVTGAGLVTRPAKRGADLAG
ncbi:hypothetical protein ACIBEF_29370 [Micromonospora sp. NPDC050795]|uniref:hypothetical protein n=1 Tax=Micromonospora sp. NPDC050795 TaxID=3364282 RepID=UPI003791A555